MNWRDLERYGSFAAGVLLATSASAQQTMVEKPTHINKIGIVEPPPVGYDPTVMSSSVNARFALPPEPDAEKAPKSHSAWLRAMLAVHNREEAIVTASPRRHGPVKGKSASAPINNTTSSVASYNWSGTSVINYPIASLRAIAALFVVPTAHQAFGKCTTGDHASLWTGIDGNEGTDVLQAGAEVDAYCVYGRVGGGQVEVGQVEGVYSPWIEWYPNYETTVSSPTLNPGDLLFVEVWNSGPTQGYAYFYNYSTNVSAEYSITAPSGTTLQDASVEWIVERPELGTTLTTLTNYIASSWSEGVAWDYAAQTPTSYFMGQNPTLGTLENMTMLDNNGNPISSATIVGNAFLWFQNTGSSCGLTSPC